MKTINRTTKGIAIAVTALALASASFAQLQEPPKPGTYYSAKDFEWSPPWPFNPHPELDAVEIAPGIFVFDDTAIPDTPAQAEARMRHEEAVARAAVIAANPALAEAERAARQAAQEAAWKANWERIAPWLHHDARLPDGSPATAEALDARQRTRQEALSAGLIGRAWEQYAAVTNYLQKSGQPAFSVAEDGTVSAVIGINKAGLPEEYMTYNRNAANTVATDRVWPGGGLNLLLTGTNTFVGLWDGGDVRISHREFSTNGVRVIDMDGASPLGIQDHPTHVCGTLNAYGANTNAIGMSHRAVVWANDFYQDYTKMGQQALSNTFRISNHSYGKRVGWSGTRNIGGTNYPAWWGNTNISQVEDYRFGFYDESARDFDSLAYLHPTYLQVWAAGNERGAPGKGPTNQPVPHAIFNTSINDWVVVTGITRPDDGDPGGFDLLSPPQTAKNSLVIGAVSNILGGWNGAASVGMSTFSSYGPTDDGRIKPDVVAPGVGVFSAGSWFDTDYYSDSGTSMASPVSAGSLNLLRQLHHQLYGTSWPLLASSLAGLAIHTADEAGSFPGPDYRFGWGLLNTAAGARLITNNHASGSLAHLKEVRMVSGDYIEFPVVVVGNTNTLKVTIRWTDPPGTPVAPSLDPTNRVLVNDLDLRVIAPSGATNFPWVLNPVTRTNAATTADNLRDNVEQVVITNAVAGTYLVRVTHKANLVNDLGQVADQWVSILISGNAAQTHPPLLITEIVPVGSNSISLTWDAVVGRVYRVQYRDDVASGAWANATGEISASKTNVSVTLSVPTGVDTRFYRVEQVR